MELSQATTEGQAATVTTSRYPMIDVDDALATVLEQATALPTTTMHIEHNPASLLGSRLANDVICAAPVPEFRASIMDGYAVVASDGEGTYSVVQNVTAGDSANRSIESGSIVYITTGAALPEGADAVVPVEDTEAIGSNRVTIKKGVSKGKWVREIGSDMAIGELVLGKECRLGSSEIGLLASLGIVAVEVFARASVGVLSTGNELVPPSNPISGSMIRDSNRSMLLAAIAECCATPVDLGITRDTEENLTNSIKSALEKVDVLVTSGGVSMGSHDFVKPILEKIGKVHFGRLCMKPGKPTTFATINIKGKTKYVFALPGNPVSSMVTFKLLVEPCIHRLGGASILESHHARVQARLAHPMTLDPARPEYHRVLLEWQEDPNGGHFLAYSTGIQRSSRLLSMRAASALLCIPQGSGRLEVGTAVTALLLSQHGGLNLIPPPSVLPHKSAKSAELSTVTKDVSNSRFAEEIRSMPKSGCLCCQNKAQSHAISCEKPPLSGGIDVMGTAMLTVGVITISDRASQGTYEDRGGPEVLITVGGIVKSKWESKAVIIPDDKDKICAEIKRLIEIENCALVLTTGGTGVGHRDVTPEATLQVVDKELPGFGERMRSISLQYIPTAILSRQTAGVYKSSLVVNLPGSPNSIRQILPEVFDAIGYCLQLIRPDFRMAWMSNITRAAAGSAPASTTVTTTLVETKSSESQTKHISASKTDVSGEPKYAIDAVNLQWLEQMEKDTKLSKSQLINRTIEYIKSDGDEKFVFEYVRGIGRVKKKVLLNYELTLESETYMQSMIKKYNIADFQKAVRIILDYALEDLSLSAILKQ